MPCSPTLSSLRRLWSRTAAPAGVAVARLRRRPGRNALLLTGIAAAVAMFVAVLGGTVVVRELSLQRLVRDLAPGDRSIRVDLVGLPALSEQLHPDAVARRALAELTPTEPIRVGAFRDFWLDGQFVRLGGIDGRRDHLRLLSGRFPTRCDADLCEVLQLGRSGKRELREADIHLVRVGVGELRDPAAFGPAFTRLRQLRAQASWVTSIVLLAPSARVLDQQPPLELLFRLASWVVPLEASDVHAWEIDHLLRREARAQAILEQADPGFALAGPDAALLEAKTRGDAYGERMALVSGSVAVALFGFALVAASGLRRGVAGERRRLAQRGATSAQTVVASGTEVGAIAACGWLVGIAVGALAVGAVATAKDLPAGPILRESLLTRDALIVLAAGFVLSLAVLLALLLGDDEGKRRSRIGPLDVAAIGVALAIVVGISRGALGAGSGANGDSTFLLLLPALVCVLGGLIAARLLKPLAVLGERVARRGPMALRLALVALARASVRTGAAGAFLVVTIALLVFAAAYAATLDRGARDEAAFAVPLDVTVTPGTDLRYPLDLASLETYGKLGSGTRPYPVLRSTATVAGDGTGTQAPTVLGIPSGALAGMHWRSDYAGPSRAALARAMAPGGDASLRGIALPTSPSTIRLDVRLRGTPLAVDLVTRDSRGRMTRTPLGMAPAGRSTLGSRLPASAREVVAVELTLTPDDRAWLLHLGHERGLVRSPSGTASFGRLMVDGRAITDWRGWVARGRTATVAGRPDRAIRVDYSFEDATSLYLRPRQWTDGRAIPLVVSPGVAAGAGPDGRISLEFFDTQIQARVAGIARRFPSIGEGEEFVVGDEVALSAALDADSPGTGTPGEIWLSVPRGAEGAVAQHLSERPLAALDATWRDALYDDAHDDPLARGVAATLTAAALVALILALVGLWASLLSDLRDERDTFFDLEVQGAGPEMLRQHLRIRAYALLGFGLLGGVVLGFVLSRLVVSLVQVTGVATDPFPPLVLDSGLGAVGAAVAALVVACVVAVELTVRRAFRGPSPERTSWSFE